VVCGGAWVNMRKTIRPSFFYEKAQRAFDSLPFYSGIKKGLQKSKGRFYVLAALNDLLCKFHGRK
jgi:hypothetical protein